MVNKRRITLNLDADLVQALEAMPERSISAAANVALRSAVAAEAHRAAALEWLGQLNAEFGEPTEQDWADARAVADELFDVPAAARAAG